MPAADHRTTLAKIKRFDQLIAYLRDEMGWPIARDSFEDVDDLFYDFTAAELGIDPKTAAKIESIKRLRPLSPKQPWGIFFVKFEPKNLPVVALRRILSKVTLKKRASANSAERAAWAADDLLFVSNYGEGDERQISFAHFSTAQDGHDLPTLKVLGWDNLDTALHLDAVAKELTQHLAWPEDETDVEAWRKNWRAAFNLRHREVVATSRDLSIRLAELARAIRDRIKTALTIETNAGPLTKLMKAFQEALVHDLDAEGFADMYAQTIAYGLLSARIADPEKKTTDDFAAHMRTNPFLRELMETFLHVGGRRGKAGGPGIDFDELGVSEVVELLDDSNMEAVVRDFGDRNPQEDPVIHFYELFLKEYDAKKRMQRGVFYTPRPVVSYIVRSVDELLRSEFGLADGLADITTWGDMAKRHKEVKIPEGIAASHALVQILDPAVGTGTFLVEVIDLIHKTLLAKWKAQGQSEKKINALWNEYVPKHLLPRLHGYELLMAPYAIAHLKIGLKLYETGYRFGSDERARIYLTNALEPAGGQQLRFDFLPALAHEANEVNEIKRNQRFTIVIGNPPYSDASQNLGPQFAPLIEPFRHYRGERIRERGAIRFEHVINNDYIKFLGLGLHLLSKVSLGAVGLITSNSYLGGKSFRGVRDAIRHSCQRVRVTDLHGEGWSGELARSGTTDENVFEVQTGVAVCCMLQRGVPQEAPNVDYGELTGSYEHKVNELLKRPLSIKFEPVPEDEHSYGSFLPAHGTSHGDYWSYPRLDELFVLSVDGIKTSRDGLVVANTRKECVEKIAWFAGSKGPQSDIERQLRFQCNRLDFNKVRKYVATTFDRSKVRTIYYRPYDIRYIYYDDELILSHRMNTMPRMLCPGSEAIVCASRLSAKGFEHALAARSLCAHKYSSHDINSRMFLIAYGDLNHAKGRLSSGVRSEYLARFLFPHELGEIERAKMFGAYVLAILNAPSYRNRYYENIYQDFPRVPLPRSATLLSELAIIGVSLGSAFCLSLQVPTGRFLFRGCLHEPCTTPRLEGRDLWIGATSYIEEVSQEVWEFKMAGYQVCSSWFTAGGRSGLARKGNELSKDFIEELRKVLFCVEETIRLQAAADEIIEAHGGWPGAFQSSASADAAAAPVVDVAAQAGN